MQKYRARIVSESERVQWEGRLGGIAIGMNCQRLVDIEFVIGATEVVNEWILGLVSRRRARSRPAPFQLRFETSSTRIKRRRNVHRLGHIVRVSAFDRRREGVVGVNGQGNVVGATSFAGVNIDAGEWSAESTEGELEIGLEDALVLELKTKSSTSRQ